jgi:hypothetical protein
MGIPVTLAVVAVVWPVLERFVEPTPVVPRSSSYCVTPVPAVHVKVALEPVRVLPALGEVSAAATGVTVLDDAE